MAPCVFAADEVTGQTGRQISKAEKLNNQGQVEDAVAVLSAQLKKSDLSPIDQFKLYLARAAIFLKAEDWAQAESDLRSAIAVEDLDDWVKDNAVYALALLLREQERATEALTLLREYVTSGGTSEMLALIRQLEIETGEIIPTDLPDQPLTPVQTGKPKLPVGCPSSNASYSVSALFNVAADAAISNIRITASTHPCLDEMAIVTIGRWRFEPAIQSGYYVKTWDIPMTMSFVR